MEFIVFLTVLIFGIVQISRTTALRLRIERLDDTLRALAEKLERATLSAGAPAAAAADDAATVAGAAQAAAASQDIVRDTAVVETPIQDTRIVEPFVPPAAPEPPVTTYVTEPFPPSPMEERLRAESTPESFGAGEAPVAAQTGAGADQGKREPKTSVPPMSPPRARPDFSDLEKRFGTQWVVWVGGIALALGGILLVRYSIEQDLFTPGLRVIAGAILALVLVGLGELARRKENATDIGETPRAHIPSILTAAGTTAAYADVWAAYVLYDFLSPGTAFVLLGLVALATLAAALVHGPALGGLGLVGAYVTPLLVSTTQPSHWALYVYLAAVTTAR